MRIDPVIPLACPRSSVLAQTAQAPRFALASFAPPERFPSLMEWLPAARRNALDLFPAPCFTQPRVRHRVAWKQMSVISDPDTVREIFISRPRAFRLCNLHLRLLRPSLGNGLIVAEGEDWRRLRRASIALLANVKEQREAGVSGGRDDMLAQVAQLACDHGQAPDLPAQLSRLVLNLLATRILGHSRMIASPAITAAIERHRDVSEKVDLMDVLGLAPGITSKRMRRARDIAGSFDDRIHEELAHRGDPKVPQVARSEHRDLIVNLLTGFESVWLTCLWSLLIMAHHPDLADWARADGPAAQRRQRLTMIIRETLRLFPPLPFIYREPVEDLVLPAGRVRKGEMICVSPYVVQRHRSLWPDPDVFDCNRPAEAYQGFPYMPFGLGARRCVGAAAGPELALDILDGLMEGHRPVATGAFPLPRGGMSLRPIGEVSLRLEVV